MSYFGNTLKALLEKKKMKAVRLAQLSGVSQPTVSRYIRGDQNWVSPQDLEAIARAISDKPTEQAQLLKARLLDEASGPWFKLINVEINGAQPKGIQNAYCIELPEILEKAMGEIRRWVLSDQNVKEIIIGLGNLLGNGDCRTSSLHKEITEVNSSKAKLPREASGISQKPESPSLIPPANQQVSAPPDLAVILVGDSSTSPARKGKALGRKLK